MFYYGDLHMDVPKLTDPQELTYSSYMQTQDVVQKTCQVWWMIEMDGERELGKSMLAARLDDDDNYVNPLNS